MRIKLAGCIIKNSKGKILLIHRNTPKRNQWEIPGGKIDIGEKPEQTAKREIKEELGINIQIIDKLGENEFSEDEYKMNYVWFNAKIISGEPELMENKFDKLNYFSIEELKEMKNELSPNAKNFVDYEKTKKVFNIS